MIMSFEIDQVMAPNARPGLVATLLEHYEGGFHQNVEAAERKRFLKWLAEYRAETMPPPAVPVGLQLDLLEAAQ